VAQRAFGSWLLGPADQTLQSALRRSTLLTWGGLLVANLAGAAGAFVLASFVFPTGGSDDLLVRNLVGGAVFYVATALLVMPWTSVVSRRRLAWARAGRVPTPKEQRRTLRMPAFVADVHALMWGLAAALFGTLNGLDDTGRGLLVALAVAIGGAITAGYSFFLTEFASRPVAAQVLAHGLPSVRLYLPGLRMRVILAWALGSAVPVIGMMAIAVSVLAGRGISRTSIAVTTLSLGGAALVVGFAVLRLSWRATTDPVRGVRAALAQVEAGDLDVRIPLYDTSDVGKLQHGFNQMVSGLREREQIRDLFGRHVGPDVARLALEGGIELGGEQREVAVLFVDVVGSTALASEASPTDVVALLNRFFGVVVDVVTAHGGLVNKLQGDAALAVFGAPVRLEAPAAAALLAGQSLVERLRVEVPECDIGVGIAYGLVVAGNIGAESRFEYTVIGDAVNEAARLTELAKEQPGRLLASGRAVEAAGAAGAAWVEVDQAVLRGRAQSTRLMVPG
jgi:adenylate cyclase